VHVRGDAETIALVCLEDDPRSLIRYN
jgi:hypothetical protein